MNDEFFALKPSIDAYLGDTSESPSTVQPEDEPFLNFDPKSKLFFRDKYRIYNSLVALVHAGYPFDDALQDKAAQFLEKLEPNLRDKTKPNKFITELVPSSSGSLSGFVASIVTLLSSPHSTVVAASLSFLRETTRTVSPSIRTNLVTNVLATVQPHTLPISGNEAIIQSFMEIIKNCIYLASPSSLHKLGINAAADQFNHRDMIFRKVVLPSSQFETFLISKRHFLDGELFDSWMELLCSYIEISPFHRQTMEFVVASPIVMAISSYRVAQK
ncbi:hypothetical protein BLNAU_4876 [Blattamonas nauphoetae]|uniref:Uncharacterized protein n=1 Tax=Blattamonas nauphoetae TaxID=2049346 RepID=A0ABQ9Y8I2_9EUKA|nr:hypothetical protein BLNAU_4876 [Blattamonas nauphoetae]